MGSDKGNIVKFRQKSKKSGEKQSREEKRNQAAANRFRTGRTGAEKKQARAQKEKERRLFEGKKLDAGPDGNGKAGETPDE